jgi:hypothetical protein
MHNKLDQSKEIKVINNKEINSLFMPEVVVADTEILSVEYTIQITV